MNIMFLTRSLNAGGAERQLTVLAQRLYMRGHRVTVAVFYANGQFQKDLEDSGVLVYVLGKSGRWDVITFLACLIKTVRSEKPDILHSYITVPNILSVMLKPFFKNTKVVTGIRSSCMDMSRYDWMALWTDRLAYWLGRFADLNIANSHAGGKYATARGISENCLQVICNGIDTEKFCPDPEGRVRLRKEWRVRPDELLVGIVGRLDPQKDHMNFIRATALLSAESPLYRFVVVGNGPSDYLCELVDFANKLGTHDRIIWAGARRDLKSVYSSFDVSCSSSSWEGFANVIAEAMACGVPCAVTDVADSALIVGALGEICPPKDASQLKFAIHELLARIAKDPELPAKCRQRIIDNFSVDRMVFATESALQQVILSEG